MLVKVSSGDDARRWGHLLRRVRLRARLAVCEECCIKICV